jgi:hypothetical protein
MFDFSYIVLGQHASNIVSYIVYYPCLRILLAIYSEATACIRQLMCTAVSQLRSDQLVPLHHHAHFIYPACLFFLYCMFCTTVHIVACRPCTLKTMYTADRNIPSSQLFAAPCLHVILAAYLIFLI